MVEVQNENMYHTLAKELLGLMGLIINWDWEKIMLDLHYVSFFVKMLEKYYETPTVVTLIILL